MLWTIAVVLVILWLLGMVSSYTLGGFIHILLVLAVIMVLIRLIQGRSPVLWWWWRGPNSGKDKVKKMNKDRVEGKIKDVAGRIERQAGEWTGDKEKQVRGTMKQAEGKTQNAWGNAKDAGKKAVSKGRTDEPDAQADESIRTEKEEERSRLRKAG
jgi:uncharacterized protein YjbJ (UPF0337 family)